MATKNQLELLDLQPWRVLVVAAHPGDIEYAASAAVAKWTSDGAEVVYLIASRGETSIPGIEPEDAALVRSAEQSASAAVVGVQVIDFLDLNDGTIEPTVAVRRSIVRDIRRFRPDVVVVMNHREHETDGTRNDADHRAVGTVALDAITAAANQWIFRDVGSAHAVDVVVVVGSPAALHAIDVSGFEDTAVEALAAHKQHLDAVAEHPMADPQLVKTALQAGAGALEGAAAAIAVEVIEYAKGRPCHSAIVKEPEYKESRFRAMKLPKKAQLSKTPARSRNAAPDTPKSRKHSGKSAPVAKQAALPQAPPVEETGSMRFKARLERNGKTIGIEIPDSVLERVGGGKRPLVSVELNQTTFESTIGTSGGKRFVVVNADRRKAAAVDVDDTFFVTVSIRTDATAGK